MFLRLAAWRSPRSLASASSSQADVKYTVENAVFDDGTSLTGYFTLNQYGNIESWDMTTMTGTNGTGTIPGFEPLLRIQQTAKL
jgi:hypothetical protein